jgi:hypothetical protein
MSNLTTQQHYEVPGGTLKVILTTDHMLSEVEREELDHIAEVCLEFQEHQRSGHLHEMIRAGAAAEEVDEALWELGGEGEISAG